MKIIGTIISMLILVGCSSQHKDFNITNESVSAGTSVTWGGEKVSLEGNKSFKNEKPLPSIRLKDSSLNDRLLAKKGNIKIISVVPSIDTPVCEVQTHALSETEGLHKNIERITVSMDLPFAQKRFKKESKLANITYLSDFHQKEFGNKTGLLVKGKGVLARAVMVVDKNGIVKYLQIVPEIADMPDMKKAIDFANSLVN